VAGDQSLSDHWATYWGAAPRPGQAPALLHCLLTPGDFYPATPQLWCHCSGLWPGQDGPCSGGLRQSLGEQLSNPNWPGAPPSPVSHFQEPGLGLCQFLAGSTQEVPEITLSVQRKAFLSSPHPTTPASPSGPVWPPPVQQPPCRRLCPVQALFLPKA
jgi:hypothetical protein